MMRLSVIGYQLLVIGCCLSVACFFSCREKVEQPTLPDEKISRIMADLFTAEAATNGLSGYTKDSLLQVYFIQVLDMHGVTKEVYEKDLRLIANDLPRMEGIVKQAEALLETGGKSGEKKQLNSE